MALAQNKSKKSRKRKKRTKVQFVADELAKDIERKNFGANGRLPTERELVERFQVSRVTVRGAIDLLEKDGSVCRASGGGRVAVGRGLLKKRSWILVQSRDGRRGVSSLPFIASYYYFPNVFLSGLRKEIGEDYSGFRFINYAQGDDVGAIIREVDFSESKGEALFLIATQLDDATIRWVREQGLIPVQHGPRRGVEPISRVDINNSKGMYKATAHLLKMGYRRILRIGAGEGWPFGDQFEGYCAAYEDAGLKYVRALWPCSEVFCKDIDALGAYLNKVKFDAVIVSNETAKDHVWHLLKNEGVKIPDEVGFIYYSRNPTLPDFFDPPVTYVQDPFEEMGAAIARLYQLELQSEDSTFTQLINPSLVVRGSCGVDKK